MITHRSKILAACAASFLVAGAAMAANVNVGRTIAANTTWTADNTYFLEGYTFVISNAVLTIEPGTVIKGRVSSGAGAASLVITRGAKIMAEGTAEAPIIFTSELDELNGNLTQRDTGLWGGLLIMGNARINSRANGQPAGDPAQDQIEGLSVTGDEVAYATFGGTNDADNSGVMKYVSIRHGGAVIGGDNEINGVSLGGVGSGTSISYVEVFANKDDGFEFFGGTVSPHHLVVSYGNDDCYDFDQGFRGSLQFLFSIQGDITTDRGDKALEWDGATSPLDATPKGDVTISNYTAIGIGSSLQPNAAAGRSNVAVNIRDNVTAKLYNSIFLNFAQGLLIESDIGTVAPDITNNIWFSHVAANNTAAGLSVEGSMAYTAAYWSTAANDNTIVDPMLVGVTYPQGAKGLDPRPAMESPARTGSVKDVTGAGLTAVDYKGAFKNDLWIQGWTKLSEALYTVVAPIELGETDPEADPDDAVVINRDSPSKAVNISTRGFVGTGFEVMTAGFAITGPETQTVLIRVAGPTLGQAPFSLPGTLADPQVALYPAGSDTPIRTNDDFGPRVATLSAEVGGFPLQPGSKDAGMVVTLAPGGYTVVVSGVGNTTGLAIVEVYEVD